MSISLSNYPALITYAAVSYALMTSAATTTIAGGNLGSDPGTTLITNFTLVPPAILDNGANAGTAILQSGNLESSISAISGTIISPITVTINTTFTPGKHYSASAITFQGITITLDAGGDPDAQFYIQADTAAITFASVTAIILDNGAQAKNVFWVAGTAIDFTGTSPASVPGIFVAGSAITFANGTTINGMLVAQTENIEFNGTGATVILPPDIVPDVVCYAKGTLILTKRGYVPIEKINAGDQIVTKGKIYNNAYIKNVKETLEPVLWISKFKLKHLNSKTRPICIQKNAFGPAPFQDLYVSPDHRLLVHGKMISAKRLLNGTTIYQPECEEVVYYHLECEEHSAIIANGLLAESYLEDNNRHVFDHSVKYRKQHLHKLHFIPKN